MSDDDTESPALDALTKANSARELLSAHRRIKGWVAKKRQQDGRQWGPLAQTYMAAMHAWDDQKAMGATFAQRAANFRKTLMAAWPRGREEEWKYLCDACNDYGLVITECLGDATCGRGKPHLAHTFGRPCWCANGQRFRGKPKPDPTDYTQSGKSKPMTKVGRR
jgi:hypothetical protein